MMPTNKYLHLIVTAFSLVLLLSFASGCGQDRAETSSKKESLTSTTKADYVKEEIPTEPGNIALGKIVYDKHCHYCHGRKGRGKGPVSIAVIPNPADFIRDEKRMAVTDEALFNSVTDGISKESGGQKLEKALAMPPFKGVLTVKERWDVIAYIRELVRGSGSEKKQN